MLLGDQQKEDGFQVACILHDFLPDQAYLTLKKALSQWGSDNVQRGIVANLVRERQQIVVKKDCASAYRIILSGGNIVRFASATGV